MKKWTLPMAVAQQFTANDYVAACYKIYCGGPNENAYNTNLFADNNGNGVYDEGETSIANPPYAGARFKGCGGYHRVSGEGYPANNGFVEQDGEYIPVFYWFGDALEPTEDGDMADFHFTDLSNPNAVIAFPADNPNHS